MAGKEEWFPIILDFPLEYGAGKLALLEHTLAGAVRVCLSEKDPREDEVAKPAAKHCAHVAEPLVVRVYAPSGKKIGSSGGSARRLSNGENQVIRPVRTWSRGSPGSSA